MTTVIFAWVVLGIVTAGGVYTLLIELDASAEIGVGALGALTFDPGWYAYCGSALGPGGFSRISRHRDIATGASEVRHWHVDSLLGHPDSSIDTVRTTADIDGECTIATNIDGEPVPEFGCSDCNCETHLRYSGQRAPLLASVQRAHSRLRDRSAKF